MAQLTCPRSSCRLQPTLLAVLLLGACARVDAPAPGALDCAGLNREIARGEREQNDPLIEKIAEMPVDLVTAIAMPWRLGNDLLPDEDPIRLGNLRETRKVRGCPGGSDLPLDNQR